MAVAEKSALFCPAFTVTLEGTVTVALLLDSATTSPPDGAAALRLTVQLAKPGAMIFEVEQDTELSEGGPCSAKDMVRTTAPVLAVIIPVWVPVT